MFFIFFTLNTSEVAQLQAPLTGCVAAGPVAGGGEGGGGREPAAGQPHQVTLRPLLLHRRQQRGAARHRLHRPQRHL